MPSPEYSLPDVLERLHENQIALEAALMELTLLVECRGRRERWAHQAGPGEAEGSGTGLMPYPS